MTRLGRLEKKVLIQAWLEELEMQKRHDPSLCFAKLRTLHRKLEHPLSQDDEELIEASAWEAWLGYLYPTWRNVHRCIEKLVKKGMMKFFHSTMGNGVKLTEKGRKMAQLCWLDSKGYVLFKDALAKLKRGSAGVALEKDLLNFLWEDAKARGIEEEVFREYWTERRLRKYEKELHVKVNRMRMRVIILDTINV